MTGLCSAGRRVPSDHLVQGGGVKENLNFMKIARVNPHREFRKRSNSYEESGMEESSREIFKCLFAVVSHLDGSLL
jgi:hypothetical protein